MTPCIHRSPAIVLAAMQRGAVLNCSFEKDGATWTLDNGTVVARDIAAQIIARCDVVGCNDGLFVGLSPQTFRHVSQLWSS
jgi:hypothetical protein